MLNRLLLVAAVLLAAGCGQKEKGFVNTGNYEFSGGTISREVLDNYLSRAVTQSGYLFSEGLPADSYYGTEDDARMLLNIGAKFIGRSIYVWMRAELFNNPDWLKNAKAKIEAYHAKDPDAIFQAALFEAIYKEHIEQVPIPEWVFTAFGLEPEKRNFRFDDMCVTSDPRFKDLWGKDTGVPDMTKTESQMWFYFMGVKYLEIGIEAFHCGQIDLICFNERDTYACFRKVQAMLREKAEAISRRGTILFDAHSTRGGAVVDGHHLLDFTSFPLRLREVLDEPLKATLQAGYLDSIIGRTLPGITPSGWYCDRLPYILEFDNWGHNPNPGKADHNHHSVWGYDEISWISLCDEAYQNWFFKYAVEYLRENDPVGFIQMPGARGTVDGRESTYRLNTASPACPTGHNGEETVKKLWKKY
ncbi:MAG: hypothetical protein IJK96_06670 [Bacteroidales bacterium]|nr:hypothetical protein [Bacteroidales bacterium]